MTVGTSGETQKASPDSLSEVLNVVHREEPACSLLKRLDTETVQPDANVAKENAVKGEIIHCAVT